MKEQLISIETAKLAKEKGFREITLRYWANYYEGEPKEKWKLMHSHEISLNWMEYAAPTQSLLQKWLRDEHGVFVLILPTINMYFAFKVMDIGVKIETPPCKDVDGTDYATYEEALEAGLQEALKLINQ